MNQVWRYIDLNSIKQLSNIQQVKQIKSLNYDDIILKYRFIKDNKRPDKLALTLRDDKWASLYFHCMARTFRGNGNCQKDLDNLQLQANDFQEAKQRFNLVLPNLYSYSTNKGQNESQLKSQIKKFNKSNLTFNFTPTQNDIFVTLIYGGLNYCNSVENDYYRGVCALIYAKQFYIHNKNYSIDETIQKLDENKNICQQVSNEQFQIECYNRENIIKFYNTFITIKQIKSTFKDQKYVFSSSQNLTMFHLYKLKKFMMIETNQTKNNVTLFNILKAIHIHYYQWQRTIKYDQIIINGFKYDVSEETIEATELEQYQISSFNCSFELNLSQSLKQVLTQCFGYPYYSYYNFDEFTNVEYELQQYQHNQTHYQTLKKQIQEAVKQYNMPVYSDFGERIERLELNNIVNYIDYVKIGNSNGVHKLLKVNVTNDFKITAIRTKQDTIITFSQQSADFYDNCWLVSEKGQFLIDLDNRKQQINILNDLNAQRLKEYNDYILASKHFQEFISCDQIQIKVQKQIEQNNVLNKLQLDQYFNFINQITFETTQQNDEILPTPTSRNDKLIVVMLFAGFLTLILITNSNHK
ncbi:Hypothetical_protein [Hexamita inflata]|uniref:Hypothetical_protein n=1 Tax=Hexamita inflata TaxID=28002 RepID=A0AA86UGS5_9EUKA|nr:Hypothetical protein HINF_LOCUS38956 [Hexamita inflata]